MKLIKLQNKYNIFAVIKARGVALIYVHITEIQLNFYVFYVYKIK